jgi:membrane dipeptidase
MLRLYYALGARYMTITHVLNTHWAHSFNQVPKHNGLTAFGKTVITEINRLGMLVDLSHVSIITMKVALAITKAPVIFFHFSALSLSNHPRNVPDDVLKMMPANGSVVMINFYPVYVVQARYEWEAARVAAEARLALVAMAQPERIAKGLTDWLAAHPEPKVTIAQVADQIEFVAKIAGHDHVGFGADYDGIDVIPGGLA